MSRPTRKMLKLISFGFQFGQGRCDYVLNCNFIKNPARRVGRSLGDEIDADMVEFVLTQRDAGAFLDCVLPLAQLLASLDCDAVIGFACNGGKHRSVICAEAIAACLDFPVCVQHLDQPQSRDCIRALVAEFLQLQPVDSVRPSFATRRGAALRARAGSTDPSLAPAQH